MRATPPHHAWAWFARQRLLWRATQRRLAVQPDPVGSRYRLVQDRQDILAALKADYPTHDAVADIVHDQINTSVFLGGADRGLPALGIRNAPRGMRWWWAAVTDSPIPDAPAPSSAQRRRQMELDLQAALRKQQELFTGWGD